MWNLKYNTNEHIYETDSQTENRVVVAKGEKVWERDVSEVWGLADANYYTQDE